MAEGRSFRRLLRVPLSAARQAEHDIDEEFRLHLELRTEELMSEGMSEEEAGREARRAFGDEAAARRALLAPQRRHFRRMRSAEWLSDVTRDVRYAARSLARSPAFTTVAVLTLALGIGANTALFSVVDAVLLEPLPFPDADEIAMIFEAHANKGPDDRNVVNPANFNDWRTRSRTFESMAAVFETPATVIRESEPREVVMQLVHPDFFAALGTAPRLGRAFTPEDGVPEQAQVVVLSDRFWRDHFGGDPNVLGSTLDMAGGGVQVIGVMPPEVDVLSSDVAFWLPTDYAWGSREGMGRFVTVIGRVAEGVSVDDAEREMIAIAEDLRREFPEKNAMWSANVVPLREHLHGDVRLGMFVVLGAVGVLLLIACVNVANLLLVRAATRRTEIAVRSSLGAGRARIARGLMIESLMLALIGGALGVAVAWVATGALVASVPLSLQIPRLANASVDVSVLMFGIGAAVLTGLIFGIAPVIEAFRADLITGLREGSRGSGGGRNARRTRAALVIAEVALSLVLLTGAGLLLRSFVALQSTDLGFDTEQVLTGRVTLSGERYSEEAARVAFFDQVVTAIGAEPGVESAGMIWWLPLSGLWSATDYYLPDQPRPLPENEPGTIVQAVEGDVFQALGIPLLRGRHIDSRDRAGSAPVAIVNAAFVEQTWPGQDPIGRRFVLPWGEEDLNMEVVGLVADTRHKDVGQSAEPTIYLPHAQFTNISSGNLVVRTSGPVPAMLGTIADRVRDVDPMIALADPMPLRAVFSDAVARPRLTSLLVGLFAGLALLLAGVGIYGVVSYSVTLRQRELGVRRALGAQTGDVAGMVVRDALRLGGAGVVIGVVTALLATRVLESLLYNVQPSDPVVFIGTAATILLITLMAALVPAIRASRVSPTEAIRYG